MAETMQRKASKLLARAGVYLRSRRMDDGTFRVELGVGRYATQLVGTGPSAAMALLELESRLHEIEVDGRLLHRMNRRSLENLSAANAERRSRPVCQRGHPLVERPGQRRCLVCQAAASKRYRVKKRARVAQKETR